MQAGVEAHKQGNFDLAIAEFRKATETDPNMAEAFLDLGEELMQTHDYGGAIPPFKRALELNSNLDAAHLQLGYALLSQGYAAEAIPHLERVNALEALGIAQIDTGQYQEAVANLSAALVKRPGDQDLLYYLGRASGLLSKRAIDALLEAYPDSARAHQEPRAVRGDVGRIDSGREDIRAQHHAGPAAGRGVVDAAVLVGGDGADVARFQFPQAGRQRLAWEADAKRARKHVGKDGQHVDAPHAAGQRRGRIPSRRCLAPAGQSA